MILAQTALAMAHMRQPEIIHVIAGTGADGKSMIMVDLLKAAFGSSFGNPSCTLLQVKHVSNEKSTRSEVSNITIVFFSVAALPCVTHVTGQVEREFQQRGHQFFSCVWLTFDECRRDQGVIEDVLKIFTSGGQMPLRSNHEQETRYFSWPFCAKAWLMNAADVPMIPSAMETSHARRFKCSFLRNTLTHDMASVDVINRIFLADQDAKTFCASPTAVWTFFHDWIFPFMQHTPFQQWHSILTAAPDDSLTAKDTCFLSAVIFVNMVHALTDNLFADIV